MTTVITSDWLPQAHRPLLQLPEEVLREERGRGGGRGAEEELRLVLAVLPGRVHHPHRDDVHQPQPHR